MKIFHVCMIIGCGVAIAPLAAMGSKSKPATEVREPKVLPESTPVSATSSSSEPSKASSSATQPVKPIDNTSDANQKVQDDVTASAATKANDKGDASKQAKKPSNKKAGKTKKAAGKKAQSTKK